MPLDVGMFVQSHTPFCDLVEGEQGYRDKCILVIGGDGNNCRQVAEKWALCLRQREVALGPLADDAMIVTGSAMS